MKVTIPITIRKYVPGPPTPSRLVSVHDEANNTDILGVEFTDGSIKIPKFQEDEIDKVCVLEQGKILFGKDGDQYKLNMDDELYNNIKDSYNFIPFEYETSFMGSDECHTFTYKMWNGEDTFADQIAFAIPLPRNFMILPGDAIKLDDTPCVASVEHFDYGDLLCVTKNGKKFVLYGENDNSVVCDAKTNTAQLQAKSCNDYFFSDNSVPENYPNAMFEFFINECNIVDENIVGMGVFTVTLFGADWVARFDINNKGTFGIPMSSFNFVEA